MHAHALISDLFKYNTAFLTKKLTGIDRAKLFVRPNHTLNPIIWIFGHIVFCRSEMLESIGIGSQSSDLADFFASGTFPLNDPAEYPHFDDLVAQYGTFGEKLCEALTKGGEELLNRRCWGKYDTVGKTIVAGYIHESNHIGQISNTLIFAEKTATGQSRMNLATRRKNSTGKILLDGLKSVLTVK